MHLHAANANTKLRSAAANPTDKVWMRVTSPETGWCN
jgi:hypothetical protein